MPDRTKLLVHLRRISSLLENAFRNGPDGTLDGKAGAEHPFFVHYSCAFYVAGCLAFLEGEDGRHSWDKAGNSSADFDAFVGDNPVSRFRELGVSKASMDALWEVRNAVIHNGDDLSKNYRPNCLEIVTAANLPGVSIQGNVVTLEEPFLEFVRVATLAVRNYHGEF